MVCWFCCVCVCGGLLCVGLLSRHHWKCYMGRNTGGARCQSGCQGDARPQMGCVSPKCVRPSAPSSPLTPVQQSTNLQTSQHKQTAANNQQPSSQTANLQPRHKHKLTTSYSQQSTSRLLFPEDTDLINPNSHEWNEPEQS